MAEIQVIGLFHEATRRPIRSTACGNWGCRTTRSPSMSGIPYSAEMLVARRCARGSGRPLWWARCLAS